MAPFGNYLTSNRLSCRILRRVVLTGVGASYVEGDIYGLPTCKVGKDSPPAAPEPWPCRASPPPW